MKTGFIGARIDQDLKSDAMIMAEIENTSLSDMVELSLRVKVDEFKTKHPELYVGRGQ